MSVNSDPLNVFFVVFPLLNVLFIIYHHTSYLNFQKLPDLVPLPPKTVDKYRVEPEVPKNVASEDPNLG